MSNEMVKGLATRWATRCQYKQHKAAVRRVGVKRNLWPSPLDQSPTRAQQEGGVASVQEVMGIGFVLRQIVFANCVKPNGRG